MSGLLRSELQRFAARRLFRWLGAILLGAILAAGVINLVTSTDDPDAGRRRAAADVSACEQERERFMREVPDGPEPGFFECPTVDELAPFYDESFRYARSIEDGTRFLGTFLLVIAFIVGASFAGGEWGSGSMGTFLTWEPRRIRVLGAKAVVAGVVFTVIAVVILAVVALVHLPAGIFRGDMDGTGTAYWGHLLPIWARSGVLAGMFAMVGVAVAVAIRNTAGTIVIGGVYAAIIDPLLAFAIFRGAWRPWTLTHLVPRFQGYPVDLPRSESGGIQVGPFVESIAEVLPVWRSAILLSLYTVAILAVAYLTFERRDVT